MKNAFLLLALATAVFFRFWQLNDFPPGLYHDEAYNGLDALSLTQGATFPRFYEGWELYAQDAHADRPPNETRFPVFFEGNYGREPLHIYLMALSVAIFGNTPFAIRLVPALAGVLAVWTTYFAASVLLWDEKREETQRGAIGRGANGAPSPPHPLALSLHQHAPLFAALTLAVLFPAVHFSRFGIRAMLFVPIETMTVAFFWLGIRALGEERGGESRRPYLYFGLSGFLLGLGIYTYAAARLFPLLFVLFIPLWLWHSKRWQSYWRYAAVMAGASIVTALPLLLFFWRYPYFFIFRIAFVSNKGTGTVEGRPYLTWLLNVGRVVRGLFWQGETHLRHNLPGRPYLDIVQSALFAIGSVTYFYRWNRLRPIFLGLWLIVMLLPTILSGDAPHFGRMTGAAPVISIIVGLGAAWLVEKVSGGNRGSGVGDRGPGIGRREKPLITYYLSLITRHFPLSTFHFSLFTIYLSLFTFSAITTYRAYFQVYANHPQIETDFYLPDWQLGQFAAAQPGDTALYLTPTQEEMATIYYALGDAERMRSYTGGQGLVPLGEAGETAVYFIRPDQNEAALEQLEGLSETPLQPTPLTNVWVVNGRYDPDAFDAFEGVEHLFDNKIALVRYRVTVDETAVTVELLWQALEEMERPYTAFVHLLDGSGQVAAQLDRPPAGYPTTDWRPNETIYDRYVVPLPAEFPAGSYTVQSGFYYLPTLQLLGEPTPLMELTIGE